MGSNKTPELVSLVLATPVITAAMQSPAWLVKLICFISPARRSVNWLLRNRLISSTLTAAALRLQPRWADRISIVQSLHPSMHEPYVKRLIEAVEAGIRLSLGRNLWMSRNPSATPSKMRTIRLIVSNKSLIGLGSRTERCPTPWCLTPASAGVKSICFLRNLVTNRSAVIGPSRDRRGRVAPVVHHRRPHNTYRFILRPTIV